MRHVLPLGQIPSDFSLLAGIEGRVRERVLGCLRAQFVAYDEGSPVRLAGSEQSRAAVLVEGRADGFVYDEDGNKSILHVFRPGQVVSCGRVFGSPTRPSFDVVARAGCSVVLFDTDHVPVSCAHCRAYVETVRDNLARAVAELDADLMEALEIRLRRTMRGKILAYLECEARRCGSLSFDIALSRQELADYLCVDRAALSRELGNLRDEGQFEFSRNHFDLHLSPKLKKAAS